MSSSNANGPHIIVTGDVTIDWNMARLTTSQVGERTWNANAVTRTCEQAGGVLMLAEVMKSVTEDIAKANPEIFRLTTIALPGETRHPEDQRFHHSYAMWEPYLADARDKKKGSVWRVKEFLGLDGSCDPKGTCQPLPLPADTPATADLVVLDDADLGFRGQEAVWPASIRQAGAAGWVLVKMASQVAKGKLWEHLVATCAPRLVVVMTANDLRCTDVHISRELSWERTAQDLFWELTHNPAVQMLSQCAHVVVSFGTAGALVLSRLPDVGTVPSWNCRLFFDAQTYEGAWGPQYQGGVIGQTCCLTASIARQLLLAPEDPDMARAIRTGVAGMRTLQALGYGPQDPKAPMREPRLPIAAITDALTGTPDETKPDYLAEAAVEDPVRFLKDTATPGKSRAGDGFWTILDDVCHASGATPDGQTGALLCRACEIVLNGPEATLKQVPLGKFGGLTTADRREIEAFHAVGTLIAEYCGKPQERPLSIAVFGPPGSGKSFGVKQVAKTLGQGAIKDITFNLSQFNDPAELLQAFHQVRDVVLSGSIPLVFWDEFDTTLGAASWGWLRHFLSPMQDGSFQEGQITHPIGRAIFVFAGGTSQSIAAFNHDKEDDPLYSKFKDAKGPDFISRLKGFINIIGPNQNLKGSLTADDHYLVRRAILLRGMLERNAPQIFADGNGAGELQIDPGVLRAFLQIGEYRHGARSMESIIAMSRLTGKHAYERSALPSEAQLSVHVNGREFHALVQAPELTGPLLEKLAAAAHSIYCKEQLAIAETKGIKAPDAAYLTYEALPEDLKEQNRANVRDISVKLARIGCIMITARGDEPPSGFPGADLDMLAEMEHDRWLRLKARQGWHYGPTTIREKYENQAMLPWQAMTREELGVHYGVELAALMGNSELPESEKQKDRSLVAAIPKILAEAGYTVAKL